MRIQKSANALESLPIPDTEPGQETPNKGGRPSRFILIPPLIENVTFTRKYARAFFRGPDGESDETRRAIVSVESKRDTATGLTHDITIPIWEGDIQVNGRIL